MVISIVIIAVSFILELILNNLLPYMIGDLSLFTPMFSIVSLLLIYPFLRKDKYKYLFTSFILGIIYDLFFTNLLFLNGILFTAIACLIIILYKYLESNYLNILLETIIIITIYELLMVLIIVLFNLVPITFIKIVYKISHSLILNIIYAELVFLIIKIIPKKYRSLSIN